MRHCFVCRKAISDSSYLTIFRLGKEGIIIPVGMKGKDVICNECYEKQKDSYEGSDLYLGPMVKGYTEYNRALTDDEYRRILESARTHGLEMIDEDAPYLVEMS